MPASTRRTTKKKTASKRGAQQQRKPREEEVIHTDSRDSRDTLTWDEMADMGDVEDFIGDEGTLPNIPARPGFSQRWIRTKIGGEDDAVNISRALNRGWRRRDPTSLPANYAALRSYEEGIGDSVGISGMVLMERPEYVSEKFRKQVKTRTDSQMQSVDESLFKEHSAGSGFGAPSRVEDKSEVTRGRPVAVDDD